MKNVVGVLFYGSSETIYCINSKLNLKIGSFVIIESSKGLMFAIVNKINCDLKDKNINNNIIRIATSQDEKINDKNVFLSTEALNYCIKQVLRYKLPMKILSADFSFDKSYLIFKFTSDNRVDFRELAKSLATKYKTRIELRQIGVRDKARQIGGVGCCGKELCCSKFNNDFESVSIGMAKNQNLSLNPSKINGCCGRLLCCLKYEDEFYKKCRKQLPKIGSTVEIEKGTGKVISLDVLNGKYKIDINGIGIVEVSICNGCNK